MPRETGTLWNARVRRLALPEVMLLTCSAEERGASPLPVKRGWGAAQFERRGGTTDRGTEQTSPFSIKNSRNCLDINGTGSQANGGWSRAVDEDGSLRSKAAVKSQSVTGLRDWLSRDKAVRRRADALTLLPPLALLPPLSLICSLSLSLSRSLALSLSLSLALSLSSSRALSLRDRRGRAS